MTFNTRWGINKGIPVTFGCNFRNYFPILMILSTLWTEIIGIKAQTKICHRTIIVPLYLAKTNRGVLAADLAQ